MLERFPRSLMVPAVLLCCIFFVIACRSAPSSEPVTTSAPDMGATQAERVDETTGFAPPETMDETIRETPSSSADRLNVETGPIRFDFDKYDLREDARRTLTRHAAKMKERENAQLKIRIEGHCDERGTVEYNLALGEKRARSARDFLISQGIPASRLSIISYGKERPSDRAHNEAAWAQNRRAEFIWRAN